MSYSLHLPQRGYRNHEGRKILAADIGSTKTSLGLFEEYEGTLSLLREDTVPSKAHASFEAVVKRFLADELDIPPTTLAIGVAGPVWDNKVKLTNLAWELDGQA